MAEWQPAGPSFWGVGGPVAPATRPEAAGLNPCRAGAGAARYGLRAVGPEGPRTASTRAPSPAHRLWLIGVDPSARNYLQVRPQGLRKLRAAQQVGTSDRAAVGIDLACQIHPNQDADPDQDAVANASWPANVRDWPRIWATGTFRGRVSRGV